MKQYNDYVYFQEFLEDLLVSKEMHKCSNCGKELILQCNINSRKNGTVCFEEVWTCPNCYK